MDSTQNTETPTQKRARLLNDLLKVDTVSSEDVAKTIRVVYDKLSAEDSKLASDIKENESDIKKVEKDIQANAREIEAVSVALTSRINKVKTAKGEDGKTPTKEQLVALIAPLIPDPIKGTDADETKILAELENKIPLLAEPIRNALELFVNEDEKLKKSAIGHLEKDLEEIRTLALKKTGNGGVGGSAGVHLFVNGAKQGKTNSLNLIGGTNVTLDYSRASGASDVTINATTGASTFLSLTDTPASYSGQALRTVRVNAGATGLEFITPAGGGNAQTADPLSQFASTTSAQLAGVMSDETGTGALVFGTSPTLVTPALGTPSALVGTNITGTAPGLTAGNVTTNANLTGVVTSTGNATAIANGAITNAMLATNPLARANHTGTQVASTISDFASAVSGNSAVTANTAKISFDSTASTKVGHITVTQAVNLDTMESDIATNNAKVGITAGQASDITANNAKVTNATHTGEVTGATALTIANNAVITARIADNAVTNVKIAGSGTRDATTFYRGDGVFAVPPSGFADPLTTNGDIIARISGSTTRLAQGANGTFLGVSGGTLGYYTPAGSGDMTLASAQTNTGAKTFNATTLLLRNVAGTFNGSFTNTNTADRIYTLPNAAGTVALTSDITGTNSGTNTGDNAVNTLYSGLVSNATHTGEVTGSGALTIATAAVTNAKLANMATKTYKGRTSALTGVPEDVAVATLKTDLVLVKGDVGLGNVDNTTDAAKPVSTAQQTALNLKQNILAEGAFVNGDKTKLDTYSEANQTANNAKVTNATHTGEVTGATALTIANNAVTTVKILNSNVTLAKIANIATNRLLGRSTAASGVIEELTVGSGLLLSAGVLSATGGGSGGSFEQAFTSQTSVVVTHNLGAYPVVDILDSGLAVIIPLNIIHSSVNAFTVTFTTSTTGRVIATLGAGTGSMVNPMTTGGDIIYGGASGTPTRLANGTVGQVLQSNGTTLAPTWATPTGGGGLTWNEVTGTSQSAVVNAGYIANNAALVTITIPTTAAVGDVVRVTGKGAGGWLIAQNASEIIHFLGSDTTTGVGGSLASTGRYDGVEIVCIVANTEWVVISSMGNITIV